MSFLRFSAAFLGRAFAEISIHECSQRRAATAWFAPFPPKPTSQRLPKIVSPGLGNRSAIVVRSTLQLPTTAIRARLFIS